jgi:hypothetical protein
VKGGGFRFSFARRIVVVVLVGERAGTVTGGVEFEALVFVGTFVFDVLAGGGGAIALPYPGFFAGAADDEAYRLGDSQLFP